MSITQPLNLSFNSCSFLFYLSFIFIDTHSYELHSFIDDDRGIIFCILRALKLSNEGHIHPRNCEMCLTQMIDRYMRGKIDLHKLFYLDFTIACV